MKLVCYWDWLLLGLTTWCSISWIGLLQPLKSKPASPNQTKFKIKEKNSTKLKPTHVFSLIHRWFHSCVGRIIATSLLKLPCRTDLQLNQKLNTPNWIEIKYDITNQIESQSKRRSYPILKKRHSFISPTNKLHHARLRSQKITNNHNQEIKVR